MMIRNGTRGRTPVTAAVLAVAAIATCGVVSTGALARVRDLEVHRGVFPVISGTLEIHGTNLLGDQIISGRSGYVRSAFGTMVKDPDFPTLSVPGPLDH